MCCEHCGSADASPIRGSGRDAPTCSCCTPREHNLKGCVRLKVTMRRKLLELCYACSRGDWKACAGCKRWAPGKVLIDGACPTCRVQQQKAA